jgi:pyruvate dehydrogenase E2 component (dihydrolipoamide acetyltransferase)
MEVPATAAGIVRDVKVKIGDRVSTGSVLANVEVADDLPASAPAVSSAPVSAAAGAAAIAEPAAVASTGTTVELLVPDIGDFREVPVISVFIKAGDAIAKDAPLVELESDKATMEVPAISGGVVGEVLVKIGDRVSEGTVLARIGLGAVAAAAEARQRASRTNPERTRARTGPARTGARGHRRTIPALDQREHRSSRQRRFGRPNSCQPGDPALRTRTRREPSGRHRQRSQRPRDAR